VLEFKDSFNTYVWYPVWASSFYLKLMVAAYVQPLLVSWCLACCSWHKTCMYHAAGRLHILSCCRTMATTATLLVINPDTCLTSGRSSRFASGAGSSGEWAPTGSASRHPWRCWPEPGPPWPGSGPGVDFANQLSPDLFRRNIICRKNTAGITGRKLIYY
jgi:hypothetical protein